MKYYIEETNFDVGNIEFYSLQAEYELDESNKKVYFIQLLNKKYIINFYLYPWESGIILCLWFNHDAFLNTNHWDEVIGLPKVLSLNEWDKYKKIARKAWPNYIDAHERGRKKDFSAPALFRLSDVESGEGKKWCLCKLFKWNYKLDDPNLSKELYMMLSYLRDYQEQIANNDLDKVDRILLNIKEGVKMGVKAYFQPLSMAKDFFSGIDWSEIASNDPNW